MKKFYITSLAIIAGVGAVANGVYAKQVTIQYWGSWNHANYKAVEKGIIDQFNKEHKGKIFVKSMDLAPGATLNEKILTAVAAGAAPDLFKLDRFEIGSFAAKDTLVSLEPFIKRDKIDRNSFFKPTWNENIYAGKVYGLPWNTDCRALYYNKTMFKQLGLDPNLPPKTWEEMMNVSKKIDMIQNNRVTRAGFLPQNGNWYFLGWLYSAGGNITDSTGKKVAWNSAAGIKALEFMFDALNKYKGFSFTAGDYFGGKVGMRLDGSWVLGETRNVKNGRKFEFGTGFPPRPSNLAKEKISWAGGFSLCIPKGSKHPQEAWEFIKYYTTRKDAQLALGTATGQIPALKSAANDDRFKKSDPLMGTFVDLLDDSMYRTVLPAGSEMYKLYVDEVGAQFLKGTKSPAEILNQTASEGQKILTRAWSRVRNK